MHDLQHAGKHCIYKVMSMTLQSTHLTDLAPDFPYSDNLIVMRRRNDMKEQSASFLHCNLSLPRM